MTEKEGLHSFIRILISKSESVSIGLHNMHDAFFVLSQFHAKFEAFFANKWIGMSIRKV